jgi:hypothetical protein
MFMGSSCNNLGVQLLIRDLILRPRIGKYLVFGLESFNESLYRAKFGERD